MSDPGSCEQSCPLAAACAERSQCLSPAIAMAGLGMVSLPEALCQFEREAVHGVCDTGRDRLSYYSWGEGPPLVFLPDVGGSNRFFVSPISLLASRFRCVACDLPANPADLFALLDHLGLPRSYVYGAGLGAAVALAAMHARPERLPRAILRRGGGVGYGDATSDRLRIGHRTCGNSSSMRPARWRHAARLGSFSGSGNLTCDLS
jgi:pimeloyl-ACP methyl ester carboxylesterase